MPTYCVTLPHFNIPDEGLLVLTRLCDRFWHRIPRFSFPSHTRVVLPLNTVVVISRYLHMDHTGTWREVSSQTRRSTRSTSTCMLLASAWPTQRSQHSHATLKERRKKKKKIMVTKCETVFTVEPRYYHQAIPEKYLIIPSSSRVK